MGAVTIAPDALLGLGMNRSANALTRLVLVSAERANLERIAKFEQGELLDLINDRRERSLNRKNLHHVLTHGMAEGLLAEGSRVNRVRLGAGFKVARGGLRPLKVLDHGRVLAACEDCDHRAIYAASWLTTEAAACPGCRAIEQRRTTA